MSDAERDLRGGIEAAELREGAMLAGTVGDDKVLLLRSEGRVHAVGAECPHYHAPLADGIVVDGTIRCPWHHACFNLATGAVERAPALMPLAVYRVDERDGRYFVGERVTPPAKSARGPESVVIVGAGAAGVNAAQTLRTEGYYGRIVLISREEQLPYDKPNLSKDFLAGHAPPEWLPLQPREFYDEQRIELRLGVEVTSIDPAAHAITTASGERIEYGALVLATGASPRTLNVSGGERAQTFRTQIDAERVAASGARSAVVIGSSFIGLEVAASLRQKELDVTVVSPDRVPLERVLGAEVGARVQQIHEQHGVQFRLGRSVASIDDRAVVLDDGSRIEGDLIVAGVGVTPDLGLARAAGVEVGNGVLVDERLRTSQPDIYACGDIASWPDAPSGERRRVEHWVVAGRQGQTVAHNILGREERFTAVPFFWSAHYDVVIAYVGYGNGWDSVQIDGKLADNDATIVYRRGGEIVAVATVGRDAVSLAAEAAMDRGDRARLEELVRK
ncbi:MAG TPA: FAD-dependent oxidoreductase [Thermoanaerobaculia bacterium]|jgi:NADPH-dependent 2,4-dienoyl-CoA reductase/sulfur reductase-like enzyme/nitrite reductase/ring-hydroxylating ferredoxin subunit